jgi:hypothetical protein
MISARLWLAARGIRFAMPLAAPGLLTSLGFASLRAPPRGACRPARRRILAAG